jgi:pyruvate,water dikinase
MAEHVLPFISVGINNVGQVGGKNASLGEMIQHLSQLGVKVPNGFATTADAFREFIKLNKLDTVIYPLLAKLDVENLLELKNTAAKIRHEILAAKFSSEFEKQVIKSYQDLCQTSGQANLAVAVRSSATAEDLPNASFAGQQETLLNISGNENILIAIKQVYASLFTDRAISYRAHQNFSHEHVALSVGIQQMVRSDLASSGVMFTLDTESGFDQVVFITSIYGLGELIVQGEVNPDEFYVFKTGLRNNHSAVIRKTLGKKQFKMIYGEPNQSERVLKIPVEPKLQNQFSLNHADIEKLAKISLIIENHYGMPMDIEWAKDGIDNDLYIVQARPETVISQQTNQVIERFELKKTGKELVICDGRAIGTKIGQGTAKIIRSSADMNLITENDVLVTDMTDPDWEPVMKKARAIVTNRGGRTCHAAIIARELGIPAIVGCQDATTTIKSGQMITVSCAEGDTGFVYDGALKFDIKRHEVGKMPVLPFKIMMNVANPDRAFDFQRLPNFGIGLARLEFIISQMIGIHPEACLNFDNLKPDLKNEILAKSAGYESPKQFYIDKLAEGISTLGAAFYPKPVIIRFSDFKSNEYANLLGGKQVEPNEENPMLGFRGASRYVSDKFQACFELELEAIKKVRHDMGLKNIWVMVPFVRTVKEAKAVSELLAKHGLVRGQDELKIMMMCEVPSNAILAEQFLAYFDGFSIGSNDLTQLTLGLDRDSSLVADQFDERNEAVKFLLSRAIQTCKKMGKYIGICGQGPSDHPDLAKWLMEQGIETVSLNPDSVLKTWLYLAEN